MHVLPTPRLGLGAGIGLRDDDDLVLRILGVDALFLGCLPGLLGGGRPNVARRVGLEVMLDDRIDALTSLLTVANLILTVEGTSRESCTSAESMGFEAHQEVLKLSVNVSDANVIGAAHALLEGSLDSLVKARAR